MKGLMLDNTHQTRCSVFVARFGHTQQLRTCIPSTVDSAARVATEKPRVLGTSQCQLPWQQLTLSFEQGSHLGIQNNGRPLVYRLAEKCSECKRPTEISSLRRRFNALMESIRLLKPQPSPPAQSPVHTAPHHILQFHLELRSPYGLRSISVLPVKKTRPVDH